MNPAPPLLSATALTRQHRVVLLLSAGVVVLGLYGYLAAGHPAATLLGRTVTMAHSGAHGHGAGWGSGFAMWMAMMVAMMLPPVLPWIWFFAAATRPSVPGLRLWGRTLLFASGYFGLWALYSAVAAAVQSGLAERALLHPVALRVAPAVAGLLFLIAGAVQFSPLKNACLKHCRSPLGYFLSRWRNGPVGAVSMGFRHGVYCLGCCWAIMGLCFALGTMNLVWMAAVTLLLCFEKIAPGGERLSRLAGVGFLAWGVVLLAPGLFR